MSTSLQIAEPNSIRRKLAISTWKAPAEGNIYGKLTVDVTEAQRYLAWLREKTGLKVTITHLVGKAVAQALAKAPGLNGVIRFGRYVRHKTVDISFLVALEEGRNLAKVKIERLDEKSVADLGEELRALAMKLHSGKDEAFNKSMQPLKMLPTWVIRPLVHTFGYLSGVWGMNVPALGLEPHPFGACVITNVGVFGLDEGFAPPTPFAHAPVLVLVGAIRDTPVVRDGQVVVRPQMTLCATIDHRYIDGAQGGVLAKVVRDVLENPWQLEGMEAPAEE
jgi:pyruvate/2-oxoglutarate dehydrogenase complex dihydrolipoamide acyltransferase (E2) component